LGALIANTEHYNPNTQTALPASIDRGIRQLPLDQIQPNPRQPRLAFDEAALAELATSIRTHGIIQPLVVTQQSDHPVYLLIAGERRWRAARLAGLETVPAMVREASPSQLLEWALIENVQRADLNPLEEATAYQSLIDEFGLTQDEVAERVGKSRPAIANAIRLLKLPPTVQAAVITGQISAGHARALVALKDAATIERACGLVVQRALSVRQTEALVNQLLAEPETPPPPPESKPALQPHIAQLEGQFRSHLGTRVNLSRHANGSGRLVIHFYNDDDLAQLYQIIIGDDRASG
jgi:ParB family chromosome partitioning protein